MDFRRASKQEYALKKKSEDLKLFQERAGLRVNQPYTQHLIKCGNTY